MAEISPVELLELFQRAQAAFTDRVDAVEPDQWEDEALPEWTVADLVAHMVTEMLWVVPLLAGEPYAEGRFPDATTHLLGKDPFESWESASDEALSAFAEDDALLRTVHLERGPPPGLPGRGPTRPGSRRRRRGGLRRRRPHPARAGEHLRCHRPADRGRPP